MNLALQPQMAMLLVARLCLGAFLLPSAILQSLWARIGSLMRLERRAENLTTLSLSWAASTSDIAAEANSGRWAAGYDGAGFRGEYQ